MDAVRKVSVQVPFPCLHARDVNVTHGQTLPHHAKVGGAFMFLESLTKEPHGMLKFNAKTSKKKFAESSAFRSWRRVLPSHKSISGPDPKLTSLQHEEKGEREKAKEFLSAE